MPNNSNDTIGSAVSRHALTIISCLIVVGISWGTFTNQVSALEDENRDLKKQVDLIKRDDAKRDVAIAQIQVTTKNIENKLNQQQRILERISTQLANQSREN